MPAQERVRWGLLGTGNINVKLLAGARLSDKVEVVAVGSRTDERGKAFAAQHGIPRVHGSYEALLADPDVDALYINLPNGMHHEWTMRSIAAGKHILCEKPYSRHPAEVREAFDAADAAGVVLQEAFMWRHSPQTRRLLELLPQIGELVNIRATFSFAIADQADIRLSKELKGGSLMDVGCYCVSGSRLLADAEPDRVYAEQVLGPSGVDVGFSGLLHFPGGVTSEIVSGFRMEHQGLEAIGTLGSIQVPDPWHSRAGNIVCNGEAIRLDAGNPYHAELDNMCAAIQGTAAPLLGRADALGQSRTIEALYRSADTGLPVTLGA
jgi:xylose dehydrogenase (NAD/NADP)